MQPGKFTELFFLDEARRLVKLEFRHADGSVSSVELVH